MSNNRKTFQFSENLAVLLELYKKKLDYKTYEQVVEHFIPKSDFDFFETEWEIFKKNILKYIPENSKRIEFLQVIEALYFIGIVNGKKISSEFIDNLKNEFGED